MPVTSSNNRLLASFEVKIAGSPLPVAAKGHIVSITVDEDAELPSTFALELTGLDDRDAEIPWLDDRLFAIGQEVEVQLGYGNDLTAILVGEITGLEPSFTFNRRPNLIVRGYDRRHRLQRGRKTRTFVQQKDSDIAAQIARDAGLTAQAEDSRTIHDYVLQANRTDWEFLQQRARQIQYEVAIENKTLLFRPVGNADSAAISLSLKAKGQEQPSLLEFYPYLSAMGQVSEVAVQGWSAKDKEAIVGQAQAGDEVSTMGGQKSGATLSQDAFGEAVNPIATHPIATQPEADQLALAQFNSTALALITGDGICEGRPDLRSGMVVAIAGIGKRFSGDYYVSATSHRYRLDGYYTHFTVRRTAI